MYTPPNHCLLCVEIDRCSQAQLRMSLRRYPEALGVCRSGVGGCCGMMEEEIPCTPESTHVEEVARGSTPP
jgi:hypothetical protein